MAGLDDDWQAWATAEMLRLALLPRVRGTTPGAGRGAARTGGRAPNSLIHEGIDGNVELARLSGQGGRDERTTKT
jgi:hypothetical protein